MDAQIESDVALISKRINDFVSVCIGFVSLISRDAPNAHGDNHLISLSGIVIDLLRKHPILSFCFLLTVKGRDALLN